MFALLFVGIAFVLASAVTIMAFAGARDGYEDDSGFHLSPQNPEPRHAEEKVQGSSTTPLPPLATAGL